MMKVGFDNEHYLAEQSAAILERVEESGDKLYLEFGGKLLYDYHAARVLPGFDPNVKMRLLQQAPRQGGNHPLHLRRGHRAARRCAPISGSPTTPTPCKLIDDLRDWGIERVGRGDHAFDDQPRPRLQEQARAPRHPRLHPPLTKGYPTDVDTIVSDEGYGANGTSRPPSRSWW